MSVVEIINWRFSMLTLFIILIIFAALLPTLACIYIILTDEDESKGDFRTALLCAMCFAGPVGCGITAGKFYLDRLLFLWRTKFTNYSFLSRLNFILRCHTLKKFRITNFHPFFLPKKIGLYLRCYKVHYRGVIHF